MNPLEVVCCCPALQFNHLALHYACQVGAKDVAVLLQSRGSSVHEGEVSNQRVCTLSTGGIGQGNYQGWLACVYRVDFCAGVLMCAAALLPCRSVRVFGRRWICRASLATISLAAYCSRCVSVFLRASACVHVRFLYGCLDLWMHGFMNACRHVCNALMLLGMLL